MLASRWEPLTEMNRLSREMDRLFGRIIELPGDVDGNKVSAEFRNGVLSITLAKSEAVKPRRIEVRAN